MTQNKTTIGYRGEVSIYADNYKTKLHNSGTQPFFDLIGKILRGGVIPYGTLPGYIMLYRETATELKNNPIVAKHTANKVLNTFVNITRGPVDDESDIEGSGIMYECTLQKTYLNMAGLDPEDSVSAAIISSDKSTILATIHIEDANELLNVLAEGSSITIRWAMYFNNLEAN